MSDRYPETDDPVLKHIFEEQAKLDAAGKPIVVSIPFPAEHAAALALIDRVREDIANAKENDFDFFGDPALARMSNEEIALDIRECTSGYEDVPDDELIAAVAAVRREVQG